jgi:hypothetical protein
MLNRLTFLALLTALSFSLIGCPSGGRGDDDTTADDDDSAVENPGGDADGDGFCPGTECDDADLEPGDCDDNDDTVNPDADEACDAKDNDCDGRVDENFDADGDGYVTVENPECVGTYAFDELDCNDLIGAINPGANETCDGNDTNCDGLIDNGLDLDNDGFRICDAPADCDDTDDDVFPGAPERCNQEDDNCDGVIDNGLAIEFQDQDGDGFTPCEGDCDDDPTAGFINYPGAQEACDEIDNDCDDDVDEDLDLDGDGVPGPYPGCLQAFGEVDCDDNDATVFPSNAEICDSIDNNCNGQADENLDFDGDGYTSCQGDCASLNPAVNPGATETCNGVDDNCDGTTDEGFDGDGDGQSPCDGDCDDTLPTVYAGAPELCDQIDNDCNGSVGPNEGDSDGDGYSGCDGDCDETSVSINPGATELCNTIDDDCDGALPADEQDNDLDGYIGCTPAGCSIALVADSDDATFFDAFDALDAMGLDTVIFTDAAVSATLTDASNFSDNQVIVWSTGYRGLSTAESSMLLSWIGAGNGLIVTGEGVLVDDSAAGDDDDSAAGDDDDSAGPPAGTVPPGTAALMAELIGSVTTGVGPVTTSCTISNASTPVTNGPYGGWGTSYSFTASSSVHDNAIVNTGSGALRVASVGSRSKIIWRPVLGGGVVAYWNGNADLGDWADPDLAAMLRNMVSDLNQGCGGTLQGGDCDDANPNAYPGTCP